MKNDNLYITLNRCLKTPDSSWYDFQREYVYILESIEEDIMNEEKENSY
jgi:hypothetical protein